MSKETTISSDDYHGPVFAQDSTIGHRSEGYTSSVDDYLQECAERDMEPDHELFTVVESKAEAPSAEDMVASAVDDLYEDAFDDIAPKKIEALQEYLNRWFETCGIVVWTPTRTRIVLSEKHRSQYAAMKE